ncbi:MAG: tRNA threonylcarbamoyladenosine dehydratase [Bacteriovoracaceae bacterium]|nr:tRNA threonylcarbamoyladenosine dehydratase [Bacteriovoracaceae bacterium]
MTKSSWSDRTELLIGKQKLKSLKNSHVLIVGLGGVGGFAAECICRAGVGEMTIVDGDVISSSNCNRQTIALHSNLGKSKAQELAGRLRDINPKLKLHVVNKYMIDDDIESLVQPYFDYIIDAIDTITPKVQLLTAALKHNKKIVSAMGAGSKFDPEKIKVTDISKTHMCPLAQAIRKRLRTQGIKKGIKAVFSPEKIDKERIIVTDGSQNKKSIVGTISYMPPLFGAVCASVVIREIIEK